MLNEMGQPVAVAENPSAKDSAHQSEQKKLPMLYRILNAYPKISHRANIEYLSSDIEKIKSEIQESQQNVVNLFAFSESLENSKKRNRKWLQNDCQRKLNSNLDEIESSEKELVVKKRRLNDLLNDKSIETAYMDYSLEEQLEEETEGSLNSRENNQTNLIDEEYDDEDAYVQQVIPATGSTLTASSSVKDSPFFRRET